MKLTTAFILFILLVASSYADNEAVRVKILFGSICCGPDANDEASVSKYIERYESQHKVKLQSTSHGGLGREGEHALCLGLNELDKQSQLEFVEGINKLLEGAKAGKVQGRDGITQVYENVPCP